MSIGSCDCCDRQNVPVSHFSECYAHPEAWACFICQGDTDPDPYGEVEAPRMSVAAVMQKFDELVAKLNSVRGAS